jgi:hypothetical protein
MAQNQGTALLAGFAQRVSDYLPTLAVGLLLMAIGLAVGWVTKRVVVRVLVWLRLDRLAGRVGWRAALGKGDVRAALYDLVGWVAMLLVVLVFLDNTLQILGLAVLSQMVDRLVVYLPNLGVVALIVGIGLFLANLVADRTEDLLDQEGIGRARLTGQLVKGVLLSFVGALALWQLRFAREIVLAGFLIGFGAMGLAFAVAVGLGTAKAIQRGWETLFERRKDE